MAFANKRYIYLAGKIELGHGATEYRSTIAPLLSKHGIYSLDPLRGKYTMRDWGGLLPNEVVIRDLQDIDRAHIVLAVMMESKEQGFGTPCEVMYAWERKIPVIFITDNKRLAYHYWVQSLCAHVFFIDTKKGDTFDSVLLQVAGHIIQWYGEGTENEVYTNPQIAQRAKHE